MLFTNSILADLWLLCILALIAGHSLVLVRSRRWLALDPLNAFWVGVLIVYVVQTIQYEQVLTAWHSADIFEETLFWIFFGMIWIVVGYELRWGVRVGLRLPPVAQRLAPNKLILSALFLIGLGLIGYAYQIDSAGGLYAWLAIPRGGTDWAMVSSYLAGLADLLPVGIILLVFQVNIHNSALLRKIFVYSLAFLMLFWFFYLGTRSRTISFTILIFAATLLPRKTNPKFWLSAATVMLLFIATNFQQNYRGYFYNLSFNLDKIDMDIAYKTVMPGFLGGDPSISSAMASKGLELNCVMSVVELVPQQVDYNYGYGFLEVFTRPIPRAIWPGKIYPAMESVQGVLRKAQLSGSYVRDLDILMGPAFTYVGHWYYVGGAIALVVAGLITGAIFRIIRTYYEHNYHFQGVPILYALLISIGFSEAVATPFYWLYTLPLILIPFWIVLKICRDKRSGISMV